MLRPVATIGAVFAIAALTFPGLAKAAARQPGAPASTLASASAYATVLRTINPRLAKPQSMAYANAVLDNARRCNVDPNLIVALVTVESHWRQNALSIHGAAGLGQLKASTARLLGVNPGLARENVRGTALYLRQLLGMFKSGRDPVRLALAGYNAGPTAVRSAGGPPSYESKHYVVKVLHELSNVRAKIAGVPVVRNLAQAAATDTALAYWLPLEGRPLSNER